jgi:hypothetical protein
MKLAKEKQRVQEKMLKLSTNKVPKLSLNAIFALAKDDKPPKPKAGVSEKYDACVTRLVNLLKEKDITVDLAEAYVANATEALKKTIEEKRKVVKVAA